MTGPQDHLEDSPEAAGSALVVWLVIKCFFTMKDLWVNSEWKYAE